MIKNQLAAFKRRIKKQIADAIFDRMMGSASEGQGRHPFGVEELKLLRQALVSQNLCCIGGQMVSSFEKEFAYTYGVPYGVASTSGTAAIHVALGALDLNPGDEVITAPITDLGTIIPILYQNCIPVFADIDDTYDIDPGPSYATALAVEGTQLAAETVGAECKCKSDEMPFRCGLAR